ncbi:MAG: anthranilate phosphoribosyltransferase [Verrucomicrobiales bacterium]
MTLSELSESLRQKRDLQAEDISAAVVWLTKEESPEAEKIAFLRELSRKGETAEEISEFAKQFLSRALVPQIDLKSLGKPVLDNCGTGGDRLDLFNVSTTAAFVLAGGGVAVAKHGNRSISSSSGGADVLEALGVPFDLDPSVLAESLKRNGMGFLFAPKFHPAFKALAPVRRQLASEGVVTIFNILGPLLNPLQPEFQMIGLFRPEILANYATTLSMLGRTRAWVFTGYTEDKQPMDELSLAGHNEIVQISGTTIQQIETLSHPLAPAATPNLRGGDATLNAEILVGILDGTITDAKRDMVLLNAAAGFHLCGLAPDLNQGVERAKESILSGAALAKLHAMQQLA